MTRVKFVIGITGGSGVGKTTLINLLYEEFDNQVSTFSLDNYYKPRAEQELDANNVINFDLPTALETDEIQRDLKKLLNGEVIEQEVYNFNNPDLQSEILRIAPKQLLIVEGIFVMHYPFLREVIDYSVFLSAAQDLQLNRRLKRDIEERNYSELDVLYQWENHVIPCYKKYVQPYASQADLIITNDHDFDDNIHTLMEIIHQEIES